MKRFLSILLTLAMVLSMVPAVGLAAHAETTTEADIKPYYGLGWSDISRMKFSNLDGMPTISVGISEETGNVTMSYGGTTNPEGMAQVMKSVMDSYPAGMRYIMLFGTAKAFKAYEDEGLHLFADKGMGELKTLFTAFIQAYAEIGGKLDGLILDTEYINMGSWYLYGDPYGGHYDENAPEGSNRNFYWDVVNHPQYATDIRPLLVERGFKFYEETTDRKSEIWSMYPTHLLSAAERVKYAGCYDIWNTVMGIRIANYLNDAVYAPLAAEYPDAIMSDYQETDVDAWQKHMSASGGKSWIAGNSIKVGNTSNHNSYQYRPDSNFYKDNDGNVVYKNPTAYNEAVYEKSSYNMFAVDANRFKQYYASTENKQLNAWIAEYDYNEGTGSASNTPYYAETILHIGMLNPQPFLIYMYRSSFESQEAYDERMQVISQLLSELTRVAGYADRKPIETPVAWNDGFILSGMYTGGRNLWRITPDTTHGMTVEDFLVTDEAPTFSANGVTITFPQGRIIADSEISVVGTCGYWVETPKDVQPIYTYEDNRYANNPSYVEDFDYADGTIFNGENANEKQAWEADADLAVQGGALALTGTATLSNVKLPKNITAGDNYAKQQAWEAAITLTQGMTAGTATLLNGAFKLDANKLYYKASTGYIELAELTHNTKYTVKVDNDFAANTATYTISANGAVVATAKDVAVAAVTLPVETIGFAAENLATTVLVDDYKLYPTGIAQDLELYKVSNGLQITTDSTTETEVAYRVSWLNATQTGKKANVVATIGGVQTVVATVEMAANADGVITGIIENEAGAELSVALVDDGIYTPETAPEGGDFDWEAEIPTVEVEVPEETVPAEPTDPVIPDPVDPIPGELPEEGAKASISLFRTNISVTYGGTPLYYKNNAYEAYRPATDENGAVITDENGATVYEGGYVGWSQTKGSADNWNVKFEWPVGSPEPILTLKDAKMVNAVASGTLYTKGTDENGNDKYSASLTRAAVGAVTGVSHDLKIVLQGDNWVHTNYGIIRASLGADQYLQNITIVGENGGKLHGSGHAIGISLANDYDLTIQNAIVEVDPVYGEGGSVVPIRTAGDGNINIINSTVTATNHKNVAISAMGTGDIYIHRSTVNATGTLTGPNPSVGPLHASAGTITISGNSKITATGTNCAGISGVKGVTINGGEVNINANGCGIHSVNGNICINGGIVNITAGNALNKAPVLGEGVVGYYGPDADHLDYYNVNAYGSKFVRFEGHVHEEVAIPAMAPTCTKAGREGNGLVCKTCGEIQVESTVIPSTGHTMVDADCETPKHCINCDYTEGEALGHTEAILPAVAATCQKTGLTEGKYCSVCNKYLVLREEIEKLPHTEVEIPAVAATDTKYGWTAGTKCAVCDEILVAPERVPALNAGAALDATYTLKVQFNSFNLTKYDTPLYLKSYEKELTDSGKNTFTAYDVTTTTDDQNWQAKLIWYTGDEGPTLYLDDFKYDVFNEDTKLFSGTNTGLTVSDAAPLKIVLQGEDSTIKASFGVVFSSDLTIESEGDTKLTVHGGACGFRGEVAGAGLTLNANVDAYKTSYYNATNFGMSVKSADIVVNGGNINVTTSGSNVYPMKIITSGNLIVNGGSLSSTGAYYAAMLPAGGTVQINGGHVLLKGSYNAVTVDGKAAAPVVAEGGCFTLKRNGTVVETLTAGTNLEVIPHAFTEVAEVPATCDAEGIVHHWHCETCGKNFADALGTEELAHTVLVGGHKWADATCTEPKTCTVCGLTEGEALGHNVVILPAKAATCLETGLTEGKYCDRCGETFVYREVTPLGDHTEEVIPGKAATETETGLTDGVKCAVCGEILVKQEIIPVLGGGADLDETYILRFGFNNYKLNKYDTPLYFKNYETTGEEKDGGGNTFNAYKVTTTTDDQDWQAKLIWYTGDEGPTLYLNGFNYDCYNEDTELFSGAEDTAMEVSAGAPLKIVLQGEDSVIKACFGVRYGASVSIESEDGAKLDMYCRSTGFYCNGTECSLTIDADVSIHQTSQYTGSFFPVYVNGGDFTVNGGDVSITASASQVYPVKVTGGNIVINGGSVYANSNQPWCLIVDAGYSVLVNGGSLEAFGSYSAVNIGGAQKTVAVPEGSCILFQYKSWSSSALTTKTSITVTRAAYIKVTHHGNLTEVPAVEATCAAPGNIQHWTCPCGKLFADAEAKQEITDVTIAADHNWIDATCTEPKTCATCGITEGAALGHVLVVLPSREPTCSEVGLTEGKKCMYCDMIVVAQAEIEKFEHTVVIVPGKDATCSEPGYTEGEKCDVCGEWITEPGELEILAHEWIDVEGKDATCTEPGYTEGVKCAVCGEWDTEPEEIAALGHTEEIIPGKAATCTEPGLTEGKKCTVCGETTVAQTEIAALGHTAGEAVKENETETSYESVIYCTVCKAEMSRETIVTACAHANTNTTEEVVKDATCTAAGTKKITVICADCGETVSETTEEIAMLGHTEEVIPGRAPTCTSNGRTEGKKCSVCGEILVAQEVIPAISHEFDENGNCVCGASQPAVTVVDENFQVEMNSFEYVKGYIFYIEKENAEGVDLTNWSAVMTASKVVTGSPFHETDNWKSFSKLINLSEYKLPNVTGTYVLFVEYLNNNGATKRVSASIDIVKKPKVTCGKDMFAIDMDGLTYKKGYIFYLENAEGADMSSWDALYAAAKVVPGSAFNATDEYKSFSNLNNLNNYLLPYVEGDYVLFMIYEDENGVEQNLARVIRMENLVEAEVTFNVDRFTIDTKGLKYYKSYFFYLESAEGVNLTNWSSVKKAAEAVPGSPYSLYEDWKTCHKQATLESTVLPNVNGVYVLFVDYWDVNGSIRQVTMTITVDDAVKPDITSGEGKIDIDMHGLEYQKAYVFYVESVKDLDTRKWSPVMTACRKVAGSPFSPTDNWKTFSKQTNLENYTLPEVTDAEGTYIIFLDYTDANGTTQQISAVINK